MESTGRQQRKQAFRGGNARAGFLKYTADTFIYKPV